MRHQLLTLIVTLSAALVFLFGMTTATVQAANHMSAKSGSSHYQMTKKPTNKHVQNHHKNKAQVTKNNHRQEHKEAKKVSRPKNVKEAKETFRPKKEVEKHCDDCFAKQKTEREISHPKPIEKERCEKCEQKQECRSKECEKCEAPRECEVNQCDCDKDVAVRTIEKEPCDCHQRCQEENKNQVVINCDDFDQHNNCFSESGQNCFGSINIQVSISIS